MKRKSLQGVNKQKKKTAAAAKTTTKRLHKKFSFRHYKKRIKYRKNFVTVIPNFFFSFFLLYTC